MSIKKISSLFDKGLKAVFGDTSPEAIEKLGQECRDCIELIAELRLGRERLEGEDPEFDELGADIKIEVHNMSQGRWRIYLASAKQLYKSEKNSRMTNEIKAAFEVI